MQSPIRDYLQAKGVPLAPEGHRHTRRGWVQLDCPDCSPGTGRWRLGITEGTMHASCWQCGRRDLWAVLRAVANATGPELHALLKGRAQLVPPTGPQVHTGAYMPPRGLQPLGPQHVQYLRGRGLCPVAAAGVWHAQATPIIGPLAWRIFIPIRDKRGRAVSWTTRAIGDVQQRYISASPAEESVPHKELLYGAEYCRHAVIVHEGPLDVWNVGPGAVCTFGLGCGAAQVAAIASYPLRAVCFDNEPKAQARARQLCNELACFPGQTHLVELDAADPGSAPPREVALLREAFLK